MEGKLAAQVLPDGATATWRYDGEGSLVEHVDALGKSTTIEQTYFDLPSPGPTRTVAVAYGYDSELRLTAVTDPGGLDWRYRYDPAGRLVRETDFNGRALSYAYDEAGRLAVRINGAGQTLAYTRDPGNVVDRRTATGVTTSPMTRWAARYGRNPTPRSGTSGTPWAARWRDRQRPHHDLHLRPGLGPRLAPPPASTPAGPSTPPAAPPGSSPPGAGWSSRTTPPDARRLAARRRRQPDQSWDPVARRLTEPHL